MKFHTLPALAGLALAGVPALAAAQSADASLSSATASVATTAVPAAERIDVCVVPGSGTVYRVGAAGTPAACLQDSHVMLSLNLTGTPGATGPQGPQGEAGPKGDKGDAGEKGDTGEKGAAGPKGDKGDVGPKGEKGEKGDVGPKGEKGDEGDAGAAGPAGAPGPMGPVGPAGSMGPMGPEGPMGPPGSSGGGISGWERVYVMSPMVNDAQTADVTVTCPAGKKVVSVGFANSEGWTNWAIIQSIPSNDGSSWSVRGYYSGGLVSNLQILGVCVTSATLP